MVAQAKSHAAVTSQVTGTARATDLPVGEGGAWLVTAVIMHAEQAQDRGRKPAPR